LPTKLADRLSAARRSRFVGRDAERGLFESALAETELPFNLIYIFGPGGVGKTALLAEFRRLAEAASVTVAALDGRDLEPSPDAFSASLSLALNLPPTQPLPEALANGRYVLFIDTYELVAPLDNWLRDSFLPSLPENVLAVIAGRNPPSTPWRTDPGWQRYLRTVPLRNLAPDESRAFMLGRNIPEDQHEAVLQFTHGYPLALSLVADEFAQRPQSQRTFEPDWAPDVIKALLERFVQKVPSPAHRAALEACALVRLITEPLLAVMLGTPDANELFNWLRDLSFVESGPQGVFPHDLAREALAADLRWRNPDWYNELHKRARAYYAAHIQETTGLAQQRTMFDYIFLHRDSPVVRPFVDWQTSGGVITDSLRESDAEAIKAMVTQHEGEASTQVVAYWLKKQPQGMLVFRDSEKQPAGFMSMINLSLIDASDREADPAAQTVRAYLDRHAPLRPGEVATLFRYWMGRDSYQAVSQVQSLVFINAVLHYLTTPGLVFTFFPCAEPDFWIPMFAYADLTRLPDADYTVGSCSFGVYGHNWRAVPPTQWLAILAERETGRGTETPKPTLVESVVVLSEPEFAAAVRDALRDYTHVEALSDNPLVQSRLVLEAGNGNSNRTERAAALQGLIRMAGEQLKASPRELKFYRALQGTYLQPAETQERAAELLDLPFSTYRRHLKTSIDRVVEILWNRELQGLSG
jgi:hypothetical protein